MQNNLQAIEIALRVLGGLSRWKTPPDADDLAELRLLAPDAANLPADELACEVVHRAIKEHAAAQTPPVLIRCRPLSVRPAGEHVKLR